MEDLTKTQLVLLTLLVSFVTSIGTGIITTSLLQEAPQAVTQTINRVVERTVERVVPNDQEDTKTVPTVTREVTTVVVKEEDQVIDAISSNSKSMVRLRRDVSGTPFYSIGALLTEDGWIVAGDAVTQKGSYIATLSDGKEYKADMVEPNNPLGVTFLKIKKDASDTTVFTGVKRGNSNNIQLGQSVIDIGGSTKDVVSIGRIASVDYQANGTSTAKIVSLIDTDITPKSGEIGSVLVTLSGEVVGMKIGAPVGTSANYIPLNSIISRLSVVQGQ